MADLLDVTIDALDDTGDGLARAGGVRLRIPFTLPGERVRVQVGVSRQETTPARVVEVLVASPDRVAPRCSHFGPDAEPGVGPCGGCSWQHIAYPEQLRLKTDIIDRCVSGAIHDAPAARPMLPSTPLDAPWGYRQKVHFVFGHAPAARRTNPRVAMGHYVRGTRRVLPVRECPVHDPRGNALAFAFGDAFAKAGVAAADASGRGVLQGLAIRVGCHTKETMATLVVTSDDDRRVRSATRRAIEQAIEPPTSFHVNLHARPDGFIFGPDTRRISGPARMRDTANGVSFVMSPTAFFQTNVRAAEILATLVLEAIPAAARVLDLYAGAGLFALPLAQRGQQVTAIEENRAAVEDGLASLRVNRIPPERCRFIARSVESALTSIKAADAVILDPPRDGCSPGVLERVFGTIRPATAVYVSCNPEALGRDLALITPHGYRVTSIQPVDMFPHTAHVETLVVLTRAEPQGARRPR